MSTSFGRLSPHEPTIGGGKVFPVRWSSSRIHRGICWIVCIPKMWRCFYHDLSKGSIVELFHRSYLQPNSSQIAGPGHVSSWSCSTGPGQKSRLGRSEIALAVVEGTMLLRLMVPKTLGLTPCVQVSLVEIWDRICHMTYSKWWEIVMQCYANLQTPAKDRNARQYKTYKDIQDLILNKGLGDTVS